MRCIQAAGRPDGPAHRLLSRQLRSPSFQLIRAAPNMTSHDVPDTNGVALLRRGNRTLFKWHRGRRYRDDVNFSAGRIIEGLRLGASVEVDLRRHAGGGFAVLHDATLDRETDGTGAVVEKWAAELRR